MKLFKVQLALWLAIIAHGSAFAQVPVRPGKWELTGTFKGIPFGGDAGRVRTVCISGETFGPIPEKTLIEASPQPSDDAESPSPPKCEYSDVNRDGARSSWKISCVSPAMTGVGNAMFISPEQVDLLETLEMKIVFGARSIQHTVHARRVGDCL